MNHIIGDDETLRPLLDLGANEEAEREAIGIAWARSAFLPE
jgi:hypothetical protein